MAFAVFIRLNAAALASAPLTEFENSQVEFQRVKTEFYEEVVYAENGPGAEAYQKY